ncbi:MAG: HPF/RaiA family ribosome-associated protein [Planctomycetes bacterium]|nr:HPF/RaiA family ribosome-associated protein [Planctomycetota bacterium]
MKTQVSIPHHEYPSNVRDFVEGKLQHLEKFYDRIVSLRAKLERETETHRVELVANVGHGTTLVVDGRGPLLDTALEEAVHRMSSVLSRHKEKLTDRHRRRNGDR